MERGALYIVWGEAAGGLLDRSVASLKRFHSNVPIHVERLPEGAGLLDKARMLTMSPFETTVFLDADTVVLGPLDFGFEMARRDGLACCICECPWAARYGEWAGQGTGEWGEDWAGRGERAGVGKTPRSPLSRGARAAPTVEYNTGVLFWSKEKAWKVFQAWEESAAMIDSSITWRRGGEWHRMAENDQAGFAKAVADTGTNPFVLPLNWNFRPAWQRSWFGKIVIWHDQMGVPGALFEGNDSAGPMVFHQLQLQVA